MSEFEEPKENLGHPDSAIRLASAVHRFHVPVMGKGRRVSFVASFKSVGTHAKTKTTLLKADDARKKLQEALDANKVSHERVVVDAKRYMPFIQQILLTCKVQPEAARLDERLWFEWSSGLEKQPQVYTSEAIMFDTVMTIACEGLGKAGAATEASVAGEFAAASRDYCAAAGIFDFLGSEYLPKWVSKGKVDDDTLPSECSIGTAEALKSLFLANAQQMAVATVLIKPGTPNYSLLAKLCLGIVEKLEVFVTKMRSDAFAQLSRMDKDVFTLVTFQENLHKALSLYFQARNLWESDSEIGLAIAMLSEATVALRTRETIAAAGMPDISKGTSLKPLNVDLVDLRGHLNKLLKRWEQDNSRIYFESVPRSVPADKKVQDGISVGKTQPYKIPEVEPLYLLMPEEGGGMVRSDSDLARELQAQYNRG